MPKNKDCWKSERVRLRGIEPGDAPLFHMWNQDSEMARNVDRVHFPTSFETTKRWIEKLLAENGTFLKDEGFWVIEDLKGSVVGAINTHSCNPYSGTFKYGICILREQQRKGYAKEAIQMILRYFFEELRYQKVTVHIYAFNTDSLHLHEEMGFKKEGQLRNMVYTEGKYYDEFLFGMTKEEFYGQT